MRSREQARYSQASVDRLDDIEGSVHFNWDRLDNTDQMAAALKVLTTTMTSHVSRFTTPIRLAKERNGYMFEQMKMAAAAHSKMLGAASDMYFNRLTRDTANAREMIATMLSSKALMGRLSKRVDDLSHRHMAGFDVAE